MTYAVSVKLRADWLLSQSCVIPEPNIKPGIHAPEEEKTYAVNMNLLAVMSHLKWIMQN